MNKQELIEKYELELKDVQLKFGSSFKTKVFEEVLEDLKQLDDPEPIKLRDVIARIKQLDIGTRKVWLDEFLNELGGDYGTLKYKDGYEQGKLEGSMVPYEEPQKVTIPKFVAGWIEKIKGKGEPLYYALDHTPPEEVDLWFCEDEVNRQNIFARAWLDGYEVEKEKRYEVKLKNTDDYLVKTNNDDYRFYNNIYTTRRKHTRKELEDAGFGWVFDCPGIEIEEVEG